MRVIAVAHAVERLDSSTFEPGDDLRLTRRTCVPAAIANGDRSVPATASQHTGVAPEDRDRRRYKPRGASDPDHSVCDASSAPGGLGCRSDSLFPVNTALNGGLTPASGAIVKLGHPRPGLHILAALDSAGPRCDPSGHARATRQDEQPGDASWSTAELKEPGDHSGKADDSRFVERFIRGECTMEECAGTSPKWCYITHAEAQQIAHRDVSPFSRQLPTTLDARPRFNQRCITSPCSTSSYGPRMATHVMPLVPFRQLARHRGQRQLTIRPHRVPKLRHRPGPPRALIRRAGAPWSPARDSLFPAAARARVALLVRSLYEIHERQHLDSAGNTNGIAARDFSACVLRFAITRETE